eukprot:3196740-Rhodomonas_salina.1
MLRMVRQLVLNLDGETTSSLIKLNLTRKAPRRPGSDSARNSVDPWPTNSCRTDSEGGRDWQ